MKCFYRSLTLLHPICNVIKDRKKEEIIKVLEEDIKISTNNRGNNNNDEDSSNSNLLEIIKTLKKVISSKSQAKIAYVLLKNRNKNQISYFI